MSNLPNINIFAPCDNYELIKCSQTIMKSKNPTYLRLGRGDEKNIFKSKRNLNGFNEIMKGDKINVISYGPIVYEVRKALKEIKENIGCYSLPFLFQKSIEKEILRIMKKSKHLFVIEEHISKTGLYSYICNLKNSKNLSVKVIGLGVTYSNIYKTGTQDYLRSLNEISSDLIKKKISRLSVQ